MLYINNTQLHAIRKQQIDDFSRRLQIHLNTHFERHSLATDEAWPNTFRLLMQRCREYHLTSEYAITIFFNTAFCLGLNFEFMTSNFQRWKFLNDCSLQNNQKSKILIAEAEHMIHGP